MNERPLSFEKKVLIKLAVGEENIIIDENDFYFCKKCNSLFNLYIDTVKDDYVVQCKGRCYQDDKIC
jgi:hypothetical protein